MRPIEVTSLHVNYPQKFGKPKVAAVDGLSLSVEEGEVVGFIGPNGAGKSTTIKSLMGFIFPASGKLSVLGHPAGSIEAKEQIGYLPEVAQYYPFMTAAEVLFLYGSAQKIQPSGLKKRIPVLLEKVGLMGREKRLLKKFSKGMLQRVGIAQAMLGDPKLLILDEVTSGLDPVGRKDIRTLLFEHKAAGKTIFFSSHELTEVARLCDRIILIDNGRKLEEHRLQDLLKKLERYKIVYKGEASFLSLPEEAKVTALPDGMCEVVISDHKEYVRSMEALLFKGVDVVETESVRGSLEDYFIDAIGGKIT